MSHNEEIKTRDGYTIVKEGYQPTINKPLQSPEIKGGYQPPVIGERKEYKPIAPPSKK